MKSISVLIISLFVPVTVSSLTLCENRSFLCNSAAGSVVVDLAVVCHDTYASLVNVSLIEGIDDPLYAKIIIQYDCYDKNGTKLPNYPKTSENMYLLTSVPQLHFEIEGERCDYGGCVYDTGGNYCWKILTKVASCPIQDVPDTPVNINVTNLTSRNLTLTWTEPFDNYAPILGYRVFYNHPSFLGGDVNLTVDGAVEELFIDDLHPGVTYEFLLLAFNIKGNGNYSDPITVTTSEEEPAGFPQNLSAVIINSTAISVTWESVLANETNGIITMYNIMGITENPFIVDDTELSVLFTELKEDFMYNFSVRAHTEIGFGPESPPFNIKTPIADVPDTPVNINFTDLTSRSLTLTWTEPTDNNALILGYHVFYTRPSFLGGDVNLTVDGAVEELFIDDLHPGVTYEFLLHAFNKKGNGNYSDPITIATLEEEPAGFPQNLSAEIINSTAIFVTWEPVLANETNGIITMYSVMGITENPFIGDDTELSVLFTELQEDVMYSFSVKARTEIGFGPESPPFNIRTPKAVTLSLPTNSLTSISTQINSTTAAQSSTPNVANIPQSGTNTVVWIVVPLSVLLAFGVSVGVSVLFILILAQKKRRLNKRSTVLHQFELEKENTLKVQCIDEISLTESQFTICHSLQVTHSFTNSQQIKENLDDTSMMVRVSKTPDLLKDHSDECCSDCLQSMDTLSTNNLESTDNNVHDRYHSMDNILLQNPEQSSFMSNANFHSDEYLSSNYNSDSKDGYVFNNDRHNLSNTIFERDSIEIDLCTEEKDTTIENELKEIRESEPVPSFSKY